MRLTVHNKLAESIYLIGGRDENSLTAALCICLFRSESFLRALLLEIGIKNIRSKYLEQIEIRYQKHRPDRREGITDVELLLKNRFHIIIEAKVGQAIPEIKQCMQYLPRFDQGVPDKYKVLAILLDSGDVGVIDLYGKKEDSLKKYLRPLIWGQLYALAQNVLRKSNNSIEKFLLSQFCYFIEREYQMKSYQEEVWVVPVSSTPLWTNGLSFYDIPIKKHIYFHPAKRKRRKSIYFAPRAHGKVEFVQKILGIDYKAAPIDYIPELSRFNWASEDHTVFLLGEPIRLPSPIKSGPIRNTVYYIDFDLLLKAKTIKEANKLKNSRIKTISTNPKETKNL